MYFCLYSLSQPQLHGLCSHNFDYFPVIIKHRLYSVCFSKTKYCQYFFMFMAWRFVKSQIIMLVKFFAPIVLQITFCLTLSWRRSLSYRNQPIDLRTGFYMITASVMKGLKWTNPLVKYKCLKPRKSPEQLSWRLFWCLHRWLWTTIRHRTQLTFTCSNSITETLEKDVKYLQS